MVSTVQKALQEKDYQTLDNLISSGKSLSLNDRLVRINTGFIKYLAEFGSVKTIRNILWKWIIHCELKTAWELDLLDVLLEGVKKRNVDLSSIGSSNRLDMILPYLVDKKPDPLENMDISDDDNPRKPFDVSTAYLEIFLKHGLDPNIIVVTDDDYQDNIPLFVCAFRQRNFPFMEMLANHPNFDVKENLQQINNDLRPLDLIREKLLGRMSNDSSNPRKRSRYDPDN